MGKYKETSISQEVNRSVGGQTFYKWRGEMLVRMKIKSNSSSTPAQQRQRQLFAELLRWCGIFSGVAALGFPGRARKQSPENAWAQANAGIVTLDTEGEVMVDYSRIICSKGTLEAPEVTVTFNAEDGSLSFLHSVDEDGRGKYATDRLFVVLLDKMRKKVKVHELNRRKDTAPVTVMLKDGWDVENLCIYAFYLREDGRRASATTYVEID